MHPVKSALFLGMFLLAAGTAYARDISFVDDEKPAKLDLSHRPYRQDGTSLSVDFLYRWLSGWTDVDEFDVAGTRLSLSSDLGADSAPGFRLGYSKKYDESSLDFEIQGFEFNGGGTLSESFNYDGDQFLGNVPFDIDGFFLLARGLYTWYPQWLAAGKSSRFGLIIGGEYPRWRLVVDADNGEKSAEDYGQFLPYPVAGMAYERRLGGIVTIDLRAIGTAFHRLPTFFQEGGMLRMSVKELDVEAGIHLDMSDHLSASLIAGYWIFDSRLQSRGEDDNKFNMRSPSLTFGLECRF